MSAGKGGAGKRNKGAIGGCPSAQTRDLRPRRRGAPLSHPLCRRCCRRRRLVAVQELPLAARLPPSHPASAVLTHGPLRSMKAIQISECGGTEVLQLVDVPIPTKTPSQASLCSCGGQHFQLRVAAFDVQCEVAGRCIQEGKPTIAREAGRHTAVQRCTTCLRRSCSQPGGMRTPIHPSCSNPPA